MVFLGGPGSLKDSFLLDIHRGVLKAAKTYDCALAGGDTVRSKTLTLAAAVGGQLKGRYLARSTASSGDLLCVAGHVGDASAGLNALENRSKNMSRADQRALVRSFFYHQPMFSASKMLAAASSVTSLIDLSDSLFDSLEILCRDSHAGADVEIENIPVSREYARLGEKDKRLLEGGEDYSLLFTVKPSALLKLSKKLKFSVIGVVQPRAHGIKIHQRGRRLSSIAPFRHF